MKRNAFTLIEIIMAMAILTIGIIGVVRLLPVGLRASKSAEMFSKAALLAQKKMEELKLAGIAKLTAQPPAVAVQGEEGEYNWQARIAEVALEEVSCCDDIRRLSLTVSWTEKGRPLSQEFVTFIHR